MTVSKPSCYKAVGFHRSTYSNSSQGRGSRSDEQTDKHAHYQIPKKTDRQTNRDRPASDHQFHSSGDKPCQGPSTHTEHRQTDRPSKHSDEKQIDRGSPVLAGAKPSQRRTDKQITKYQKTQYKLTVRDPSVVGAKPSQRRTDKQITKYQKTHTN